MIITDTDPHTVVMQGGQIQAVEGGAGLLTLDVEVGHIIAIGGSGGMDVTETAGVTGGNQYTTAVGSVNMLDLVGLGMNSIDSEGSDTIVAGDGNETGVINGNAIVTGGAGTSQWSVNGTASIYTGTGSEFMTLGATANLVITGTNSFFQLNSNGGRQPGTRSTQVLLLSAHFQGGLCRCKYTQERPISPPPAVAMELSSIWTKVTPTSGALGDTI